MQPKRCIGLAVLGIVLTLTSGPFAAEEENLPNPNQPDVDAQILIDKCWSRYKPDLSAIQLGRIRRGQLRTIECLTDIALDEMYQIFKDGKGLSRKQAEEKIDALLKAVYELYWPIHNQNIYCRQKGCGFFNDSLPLYAETWFLESVIQHVMHLRYINDPPMKGSDNVK